MWEFIWANSQQIGNLSTAAAAILAIFALPLAWIQINASRHTQRMVNAEEKFNQWAELAIQHPDLFAPDLKKLLAQGDLPRYTMFVAFLLHACEEVLAVYRGNSAWEKTVILHLRLHLEYLRSELFFREFADCYEPRLQELIKKAQKAGPLNLEAPGLLDERPS